MTSCRAPGLPFGRLAALLLLLISLNGCASTPDAMPAGYLAAAPDAALLLPPPPAVESAADLRDVASFNAAETPENIQDDDPRWLAANDDAAALDSAPLVARFADVLPVALTPDNAPTLMHLLDRAAADSYAAVVPAKPFFNRPRPLYRFHIERFCHAHITVQTDHGDSYPSGHATRGWHVALVLAQLMPDHAPQILQRGMEYGQSRIICRVHYPSDVAAGQLLATDLFANEQQSPDFQRDFAAAKLEIEKLR